MYGVVHVLAVDGYSRKIVGFIILPRKNPTAIYRYLFHPIHMRYGVWQQLCMDHGTKFALVFTAQQLVAHMRVPSDRHPVLQSLSRHNHRAERLWPEVNARINYLTMFLFDVSTTDAVIVDIGTHIMKPSLVF